MASVIFPNYEGFCNPYLDLIKSEPLITNTSKKEGFSAFIEGIEDAAKSAMLIDYEKQVDLTAKAITVLDWGIYGMFLSLEGLVLGHRFFPNIPIEESGLIPLASKILSIVALPVYGFFLFVAVVLGIVELINIQRAYGLLSKLKSPLLDLTQKIAILKYNFFTLNNVEHTKLYQLVESKFAHLPKNEKASLFNDIAKKVLDLKFEALKRRITPGLADEVSKELNSIIRDLQQPETKDKALERATVLLDSVTQQTKNKIIVHFLGFIAFSISLISIIGFFVGLTSFAFVMAVGTISSLFFALKFLANKGSVELELENYKSRISALS